MSTNQRTANQRKAARYLRRIGFPDARATADVEHYQGTADIACLYSLPHLHVAVHCRAQIGIGSTILANAIERATRDAAGNRIATVLWRRDRDPWCLTVPTSIARHAAPTYCGDHDIAVVLAELQRDWATRQSP